MERVKIMFGTDESTAANNMSSLSNLAGTLKANLQKFGSNEEATFTETFNTVTSNETSEPLSIFPQRNDTLSNLIPRQTWIETEMSYDDTNTILEDVEELQKDKEKDKELRDRDHSLSGMWRSALGSLPQYANGCCKAALVASLSSSLKVHFLSCNAKGKYVHPSEYATNGNNTLLASLIPWFRLIFCLQFNVFPAVKVKITNEYFVF